MSTPPRFGSDPLSSGGRRTAQVMRRWAVVLTAHAVFVGWVIGTQPLRAALAPMVIQGGLAWAADVALVGRRIR